MWPILQAQPSAAKFLGRPEGKCYLVGLRCASMDGGTSQCQCFEVSISLLRFGANPIVFFARRSSLHRILVAFTVFRSLSFVGFRFLKLTQMIAFALTRLDLFDMRLAACLAQTANSLDLLAQGRFQIALIIL